MRMVLKTFQLYENEDFQKSSLFLKSSAQYLQGKKMANSWKNLSIDFISSLVGVTG